MTDKTTKKKIERIVRIKKRILKESSNLEKNYKTLLKILKNILVFLIRLYLKNN